MTTDPELLASIYNAGERLVPGETHDRDEIVRHKSSYAFFRKVIESDVLQSPDLLSKGIRILDIGCGTGHGTFMLSDILGATVTGIDPSAESIGYARTNYGASNVEYLNVDAEAFVAERREFDYVVSRHALEHVENGLNFALRAVFRRRLIVNVPYNEPEGNVFHLVNWIKEDAFDQYPNREFFYEGLDGITTAVRSEINPPNSIICVSNANGIAAVNDMLTFPLGPWQPEFLQELGIGALELETRRCQDREAELAFALDLQRRESSVAAAEASLDTRASELESRILRRESSVAAAEAKLNTTASEIESQMLKRELELAEQESLLKKKELALQEREQLLNQRFDEYQQLFVVRMKRQVTRFFG
jgi:SAM-dependent methyltransferase